MTFVDTNYFLRFLLKDNLKQHHQAKELFLDAARGKIRLTTSTIVFFEVYWVFKSYYEKSKEEIVEILQKLLSMDFIQITDKKILQDCLELFNKTNFSLEDCYNLTFARANRAQEFKTFDEKLAREFEEKQT